MSELPRSDEELQLAELARRVLPGGGFGNVSSDIVIREGRGGRVWDVSGNEYVDFLLGSGPMFYAVVVEQLGSHDGHEVACAIDALRQNGKIGRDRDGRYHLMTSKPGVTGIVGELYHDPNEGA